MFNCDTILVIGIGPAIGLMSVAGCAIRGASEIYAVGSRPNCVELAKNRQHTLSTTKMVQSKIKLWN